MSRCKGILTSRTWAQGSIIFKMPWTFFLFDSSEILIRSIKSINRGSPKIQALWKKYSTQLKNEGSSAVGIPWRRSGIFQVPSHFEDEVCKEAAQRCVLIRTCPLNTVTISAQKSDSDNRENKVSYSSTKRILFIAWNYILAEFWLVFLSHS